MQRENLLRALRDLAELYQSGGLTREEFESTKQLLLAQMRRINEADSSGARGSSASPRSQSPSGRKSSPPPTHSLPSPPELRAPRDGATQPHRMPIDGADQALQSLLQDLNDMRHQGALDQGTFQAGQQYLLEQLQGQGTMPTQQGRTIQDFGSGTNSPHNQGTQPKPMSATPPTGMLPLTIAPGQILLGRYQLLKLLGQGGMGQVFLCYDKVREGHYALKVIHPHLAQYHDLRQRFLQELKVTERLTHPGIVRTYTLEQDPQSGFLFFTMEFVKGVTLESLLRQAEEAERVPPLPLRTLVPILDELIQILEYAHQQGVIHRDLKPSNIMIGESYHVKLMDFGIAKVLEGTAVSKHTGFGGFVYYMAPEQLRGGGIVSPSSDVFSLGVISYQLMTGEIPMGTIEPPSALWTQLPTDVDKVILKAMSPRSHQRYATPREFWNALLKALQPMLTNVALPSVAAHPTRPVSLDEVLEKLQQTNPNDAIELSARSEMSTQLAQQLLQDLATVDVPSPPNAYHEDAAAAIDDSGADRDNQVYPDLVNEVFPELSPPDDEPVFPPTPDRSLSASIEISLDQEQVASVQAPHLRTSNDTPYKSLLLPGPPEGIQQKVLKARDNSPLLHMVQIPKGPFLMGSADDSPLSYDNEQPQRTVQLGSYWIARTPVTHQMWWKFTQESGYKRPHQEYLRMWSDGKPPESMLEHPVVDISIEDAIAFCGFYELSIPTEAQWEKAARGADGQIWPWGNQPPTPEHCNFRDAGLGHTTPVAYYPKGMSPYGLLDCSGNAWEWCCDHWSLDWLQEMGEKPIEPRYVQPASSSPEEEKGRQQYSIRGGCYRYHARGVRSSFRYSASAPAPYIGLRVIQPA